MISFARTRFRAFAAPLFTVAAVALVAGAVAAADPHARFSSATAYTGAPDLSLTLSMIVAGGGLAHFDSTKLVGTLAGPNTKAEVAALTKKFGAANVKSFLTVFNFVVSDSLKIVTEKKVPLPSKPAPSPSDGKALAAALYTAGVNSESKYNVEVMLDKLVSHPIHDTVMDDIDAKFGQKADANYYIVLTQAMTDLKAAYKL
ncbi:MAG: hypothetical protein ABR591_04860 [Candidatus Velthaea sp.]